MDDGGGGGGLSTLSEEISRSAVMEPDGKIISSKPVTDDAVEMHSMATSGAHQNAQSAAFSDASQPTSINFLSSSEKKEDQLKCDGPSDPSLIYIQEQNTRVAGGGDTDFKPKSAKKPSNLESSALSSGDFDDYGDSRPSGEANDLVHRTTKSRGNNKTTNNTAQSLKALVPPVDPERARQVLESPDAVAQHISPLPTKE